MKPIRPLRDSGPLTIVVVVGIALSILAYATVRQYRSDQAHAAFSGQATGYTNLIVDGFSRVIFTIESVGAFYNASSAITPTQFAEYSAPLLDRFPTITALGWVPRITQDGRAEFERVAQQDFPGFRITEVGPDKNLMTATPRPVHFPVLLIHPYVGNEAARGFDLYSDPIRRAAIDAAIEHGRTTSTARIRLVQERGQQYSVLLINPVFERQGSSLKKRGIRGVASAVYRIGDGVERALAQVNPSGTDVWLFDRSNEADHQFLYFHRAGQPAGKHAQTIPEPLLSGMHYTHDFRLGERDFRLVMAPTEGHFERDSDYLAWATLIGGLVFTGLLAAYIALVLRRSHDLLVGRRALEYQVSERERAEQQIRQANQELRNLSREDPLMGIPNRRYFDEYFAQEWRRAIRHKTPLSLLLGDVDHFKKYNDTFGHVAGDECLRRIAQVLREALDRPGDLVARYGGEEIALVLPSTPPMGARDLAEKIRVLVSSMSSIEADAKPVTVSIGYGTIEPPRDSSMEDFIKAVDQALYRAKQQGRNQTVSIESAACARPAVRNY